jgi:NAD(P)-dependent dehydrogenase (short-subunit alcohol dehydrogenase family)
LDLFRVDGKVAVVTAGAGVICGALAKGLAEAGARVAVADLNLDGADAVAETIRGAGGQAQGYALDVFDPASLQACADAIGQDFGAPDILINGVGGNMAGATTNPEQSFFDLPAPALLKVIDLNLVGGTILPTQVFGKRMVENPHGGVILNISSMNAFRPLTRIPGYSAAKAAVSNFTQWLAVHLAQEYSPNLRVNAIAPGFFLTDQNRYLLTDKESGCPTPRGESIIAHTPMGRYGAPEDLVGTAVWLSSDAARFVTGIVVPVDGGFSAYSGV